MINIGVLVIILNDKDQILLGRRTDNKLLSLPGGKIEFGESFERCAEREVKEETNLDIDISKLAQVGAVNVTRMHLNFHSVLIMQRYFVNEEQIQQIQNTEPDKCYGWQFYDIHSLVTDEIQKELGHAIKEFILQYFQNDIAKFLSHCKESQNRN